MKTNAVQVERRSVVRNRPLLTLMLGHFTIDMYAGLLPILFPPFAARFNLDLTTIGFITLAYSGASSISQPFFGWIADRYGTRLIGAALIWTAATFAILGFAPSFPALILLAAAAGLGSGTFHPLGALNARAVISDRQRNTAMSIYVTGGTLGFAVGPLVGVAVLSAFHLRGTVAAAVPGLLIALWLVYEMRSIALRPRARGASVDRVAPAVSKLAIVAVIAIMMARSWMMSSIQAFVPTWYQELGYSKEFYGALATVITLASAVGTVGIGSLADRYGRRVIIAGSLVASVPFVLLFAAFTGPIGFLTGALIGFTGAASGPILLVMAQQLMAGRAGMASGLILGIGFVTGAIGVPITGALGDAYGLQTAMALQVVVLLIAIPVTLLIPSERRMVELTAT